MEFRTRKIENQIQTIDEDYVDLAKIQTMERKIQNLLNTIENDNIIKNKITQEDLTSYCGSVKKMKEEINKNTIDNKMKATVFDALDKRLRNYLDTFYMKYA
jgi:hypothetical protein